MSVPESAGDSEPDREVFDQDELLASIHGDRDLLEQFIQLFLRDFPPKIQQLRAAVPTEELTQNDSGNVPNPARLRDAAHKILGSARTMRLHRLARAAGDLQQLVDSGEFVDHQLTSGVKRIVDEYHAVVAVLRR
jgi:HPt (histidine-containing phosphotransfer) domain-containing protein